MHPSYSYFTNWRAGIVTVSPHPLLALVSLPGSSLTALSLFLTESLSHTKFHREFPSRTQATAHNRVLFLLSVRKSRSVFSVTGVWCRCSFVSLYFFKTTNLLLQPIRLVKSWRKRRVGRRPPPVVVLILIVLMLVWQIVISNKAIYWRSLRNRATPRQPLLRRHRRWRRRTSLRLVCHEYYHHPPRLRLLLLLLLQLLRTRTSRKNSVDRLPWWRVCNRIYPIRRKTTRAVRRVPPIFIVPPKVGNANPIWPRNTNPPPHDPIQQ